MRITVFGATGRVGGRVVDLLGAEGHQIVLVDLLDSPPFEDRSALGFFTTTTTRNLLTAARAVVARHGDRADQVHRLAGRVLTGPTAAGAT